MKEGKKSIKGHIIHIKNYFIELPKPKKIRIGAIAGAVVLITIIITLLLNLNASGYRVLYSDLDTAEANTIYHKLQEAGAKPQLNENGEIMVPAKEYDVWLLQLAAEGYPKSTLSYDIFANHSGMTATESEKKQWLVFQLQDRIQETLLRIDGVTGSTVTITLPDQSDYIWEQATTAEKATAGVLLHLQDGVTLSGDQVKAIKNLVASGVPQMDAADVTVVDSATSLELFGDDEDGEALTSSQNLMFEREVQKQIEDNIVRLLSPRYGGNGVVAAAKVTLDYDKMMTEQMDLVEKPEGGGFITEFGENYTINGEQTAGGIIGEENNTDIPGQAYTKPNNNGGVTEYHREIKYDYSYIKTQIEKGNAALKRATVSVLVDEMNLTDARRQELVSLVSNSADIAPEFISVSAFKPDVVEEQPEEPETAAPIPLWVFIVAGAALLLVLLLIVMVILMRKKAVQIEQEKEEEIENSQQDLMAEIERYKQELSENAKSKVSAKDDAIASEVRDFAKENPEITANLLRSWLKESE